MTNFDKFGQKYCNTCKYDYQSDACNDIIECCKCPNYDCMADENGYICCHCLEDAAPETDTCPYYKENLDE